MKGLLKNALLAVLLIQSAFLFSCRKDDPDTVDPASVKLQLKSTTTTSITFSVVPENAVSFSYAVAKSGEIGNAEFITVESGDSTEITVSSLEPQTNYTVAAKAVNEVGQESETVTVEALTTSEASIAIELLETGSKSVKFKVSPLNAARYGYACVPTAEAETCELNEVGDGEVAEYEIKDLVPSTNYTIVAQAFSASGEESKRVYRVFRTEIDPYVEIGEIQVTDVDAAIPFVSENVKQLYYAVVPSGTEPDTDSYKKIDMNENPLSSLPVYGLSPETGYTVYMYGTNVNGYSGDPVSKDFTTLAEGESDLKMVISDITSLDAKVTMTFNTEVYSKVCWIVDTPEAIADPSAFNWDEAINVIWTAKTVRSADSGNPFSISASFSRLQVNPAMTLRVGCVPVDNEKNILVEKAVWKDVVLENLEFGLSDAAVEMEISKLTHRGLDYTVKSSGAVGYYYSIAPREEIENIEDYVLDFVLKFGYYTTEFDKLIQVVNLEIGKDYSFVALPVDSEGNFGDYFVQEFSTKGVNTDGKAKVNVSLVKNDYTHFEYECTVDENTENLYWFCFDPSTNMSEEAIQGELLCRYNNMVKSDGLLNVVAFMKCNAEYEVWFCAEDKEGNLSEIRKEKVRTKKPEFNGVGNVDLKLTRSGDSFVCEINPDSNVLRYWNCVMMDNVLASYSGDELNEYVVSTIMQIRGVDSDGNPVFENPEHKGAYTDSGIAYGKCTYVVVAEDTSGNLLPIIMQKM